MNLRGLRTKLLFWYITSLVIVIVFFYTFIHFFPLPNGDFYFVLLISALALLGYLIITQVTDSLTNLSTQIKSITSQNLEEKVTVRHSNDEIEELAVSFNQLLDRLSASFKREQQFIGDMAHELTTPLATLKNSFEVVLSRKRDQKEYKNLTKNALQDVDRLNAIIKDILDLAWSEADTTKHLETSFDLSDLVEELREIVSTMAREKKIQVIGKTDSSISIWGDKDKIFRAIFNISENAIKYTPKNSTVEINLLKQADHALLRVRDSGPGIPETEQSQVFNRFYRGTKTKETSGTGLGLSIANSIIKAHRGAIDVKSKIGQGTEFRIILPLKLS